jgi:hypothetical protein
LRIAVENRNHHPVGSRSYGIVENSVQFLRRHPQEAGQRRVAGSLAPFAEQMKHEEQRIRLCPAVRARRNIALDLGNEDRGEFLAPLGRCGEGRARQSLRTRKFPDNGFQFHFCIPAFSRADDGRPVESRQMRHRRYPQPSPRSLTAPEAGFPMAGPRSQGLARNPPRE